MYKAWGGEDGLARLPLSTCGEIFRGPEVAPALYT